MKRWIGSLVLCTFIITGVTAPACAGLNKGNFIPCVQNKSSATGSRAIVHYIKKGDTLWDISRTYNVDLQTIMTINNMNKKAASLPNIRVKQLYYYYFFHYTCAHQPAA